MLSLYVPVLVLAALAAVFAVFSLVAGALAGPKRWNRAKLQSYECGIEPTPQARGGGRFPVKYYLTAMLFILFDIEIIFLYPWAVIYRDLGAFGLVEILVFAVAVFGSFVYLISNRALDWGPLQRARRQSPLVSDERTLRTTIRRVGLEGRDEPEPAEDEPKEVGV